ncbi:hypothetical protein PG997_014840 [Apiospora hydei]|uniref:Rhodopsin domain-containing protein n=1 Tax=Apiospora hydei TaxID=1337664 RepID=A0ABR1UV04_9PEZI
MSYLDPRQMPPGIDPYMTPAGVVPPGYESNFLDPHRKHGLLDWPSFQPYQLRHGLVCDDYLCIAAGPYHSPEGREFLTTLYSSPVLGFVGLTYFAMLDDTYGRHIWDIPVASVTAKIIKESCSITLVYCAAAALINNSLFLFRRMFSPMPRSKYMIRFGIIFNTISYTVLSLVWLVYSVPHAEDAGWMDLAYTERMGEHTPKINVALGAVSTFTDYFAIAVPLSIVSGLKLSFGKKIGVSAVFATGLFACACSTAGLVYRLQNFHAAIVIKHADPYWLSMPAYGLAVAEVNVGIFCACVPVCFPLFKTVLETLGQTASACKQYVLGPKEPSTQSPDMENGQCTAVSLLPKVSRVNLKTLLSILRSPNDPRTKTSQDGVTVTRDTDIESSSYSDMGSVDMDYHRYLVNGH